MYLARSIEDPKEFIALKIINKSYLKNENAFKAVEQEIDTLNFLKHKNIVNILGYGDQGRVVTRSGRKEKYHVFIEMEYVQGPVLFDLCKNNGGMGEDAGRFFLNQLLDGLEYMHG